MLSASVITRAYFTLFMKFSKIIFSFSIFKSTVVQSIYRQNYKCIFLLVRKNLYFFITHRLFNTIDIYSQIIELMQWAHANHMANRNFESIFTETINNHSTLIFHLGCCLSSFKDIFFFTKKNIILYIHIQLSVPPSYKFSNHLKQKTLKIGINV